MVLVNPSLRQIKYLFQRKVLLLPSRDCTFLHFARNGLFLDPYGRPGRLFPFARAPSPVTTTTTSMLVSVAVPTPPVVSLSVYVSWSSKFPEGQSHCQSAPPNCTYTLEILRFNSPLSVRQTHRYLQSQLCCQQYRPCTLAPACSATQVYSSHAVATS